MVEVQMGKTCIFNSNDKTKQSKALCEAAAKHTKHTLTQMTQKTSGFLVQYTL